MTMAGDANEGSAAMLGSAVLWDDPCLSARKSPAKSHHSVRQVGSLGNSIDGSGSWVAFHLLDKDGNFVQGGWVPQNHLIIRPLDLITPLSPSAMGRSEQPPGGTGTALIKRLADPRRAASKNGKWNMSDILTDYREWRSRQEDRIGTHSPECHVWPRHERCMIHRLARELERTRAALVAVATQDGTLSVSGGRLFVDCDGVEELAFDIKPPEVRRQTGTA